MPISLSDSELAIVLAAASPLQPSERDQFLRDVAAQLQRYQDIGPGLVLRVSAKVQRQHLSPPTFSGHRGIAKYDW